MGSICNLQQVNLQSLTIYLIPDIIGGDVSDLVGEIGHLKSLMFLTIDDLRDENPSLISLSSLASLQCLKELKLCNCEFFGLGFLQAVPLQKLVLDNVDICLQSHYASNTLQSLEFVSAIRLGDLNFLSGQATDLPGLQVLLVTGLDLDLSQEAEGVTDDVRLQQFESMMLKLSCYPAKMSKIFTLLGHTWFSLEISARMIQAILLMKADFTTVAELTLQCWRIGPGFFAALSKVYLGSRKLTLQIFYWDNDFHLLLDVVDCMPALQSASVGHYEAVPPDALAACMKAQLADRPFDLELRMVLGAKYQQTLVDYTKTAWACMLLGMPPRSHTVRLGLILCSDRL